MKNVTPNKVIKYIQNAYHKYYDSAFWMKDEILMQERQELLNESGLTAQDIFLEVVLPYPSEVSIIDACNEIGLSENVADKLGKILFFVGVLKVTNENCKSEVWIRGSVSVPKCYGAGTLWQSHKKIRFEL